MLQEAINSGRQYEMFDKIRPYLDEGILNEVVAEGLEGEAEGKVLKLGFFWRVAMLYNDKIGLKDIKEDELDIFFRNELMPAIKKILEERGYAYKLKEIAKKSVAIVNNKQDESLNKFRKYKESRPDIYG